MNARLRRTGFLITGLLILLRFDFADAERPILMEELNQKAIHQLYDNGDFETVIEVLEKFQKRFPRHSFSDSVFIAKHLAVVYAASPETREKGRYYMMRLLDLVPEAKLVDMFVSEEIERIFQRVREECIAKQRGFGLDTLTVPVAEPSKPLGNPSGRESTGNTQGSGWNRPRNWFIIGAGLAGLTAVGTAAFLYFDDNDSRSNPPEVFVPKDLPE